MNIIIEDFSADFFIRFLERYYKFQEGILGHECVINPRRKDINKNKHEYYMEAITDNGINKRYYFLYNEYKDKENYTNKDILIKTIKEIKELNKIEFGKKESNIKPYDFEFITMLKEKDISKLNLNINIKGIEYVEKIVNENLIIYAKTVYETEPISTLEELLKSISPEERKKYNDGIIEGFLNRIDQISLSLVLGAGVSFDFGALNWDQLMDAYSDDLRGSDNPPRAPYVISPNDVYNKIGDSNLIKAKLAKDIYYSVDRDPGRYPSRYYEILKEGLYPTNSTKSKTKFTEENEGIQLKEGKEKEDLLLYHIARIMDKYKEKRYFNIITYNYDNYLELVIENILESEHNFSYQSLYKSNTKIQDCVPIYHVHGFFPYRNNINDSLNRHLESIILNEDDYNALYNNPYRWEMAVQLLAYRENTCVFVGLSIKDPNIRRILSIANKENISLGNRYGQHYVIMENKIDGSLLNEHDYMVIENHFEKIGVIVVWANDYGRSILERMY